MRVIVTAQAERKFDAEEHLSFGLMSVQEKKDALQHIQKEFEKMFKKEGATEVSVVVTIAD